MYLHEGECCVNDETINQQVLLSPGDRLRSTASIACGGLNVFREFESGLSCSDGLRELERSRLERNETGDGCLEEGSEKPKIPPQLASLLLFEGVWSCKSILPPPIGTLRVSFERRAAIEPSLTDPGSISTVPES